jgi:hypothetical protein
MASTQKTRIDPATATRLVAPPLKNTLFGADWGGFLMLGVRNLLVFTIKDDIGFEKQLKKSIIMGSDPLGGRLNFDQFDLEIKAFSVAHL